MKREAPQYGRQKGFANSELTIKSVFFKKSTSCIQCTTTDTIKHSYPVLLFQLRYTNTLTVGFLVAGSGTWTAELFGLSSARVGDEESSVVVQQGVLDLLLGSLIDV